MVVTELAEYKRLKEEMAAMESKYKEEADNMKRELARLRGRAPQGERMGGGGETVNFGGNTGNMCRDIGRTDDSVEVRRPTSRNDSGYSGANASRFIPVGGPVDSSPVTILLKLRNSPESLSPLVTDNLYYSMKHFRHENRPLPSGIKIKLYLWLNIIKLDPQLTALWYKITTMQKSYHMYKTSLLSQSRSSASDVRPLVSTSACASPACGHHRCPVVACEFDMMVEESNRAGTPAIGSGSEGASRSVSRAGSQVYMDPISTEGSEFDSLKVKKEDKDVINNLNDDGVALLTCIQRLWNGIRNYGKGNEKLSYSQLLFLLDFYLRDGTQCPYLSVLCGEVESQHLFRFFRPNLMHLFRQDGEDIRLNISVFLSEMPDSEVRSRLKQQGVYLSMLALIVEESLDVLRLKRGLTPGIVAEFHAMFPLEADHQGLGYKQTNVLGQVRDFVESIVTNKKSAVCSLMLSICILIGLLNRYISVYKRDGVVSHGSDLFTSVFSWTLDIIDQDGDRLELWADPAQVTFRGSHGTNDRQSALRLLLCQVWADFMRIVNLVVLTVIPIVKHLHRLDRLLESFLDEITAVEPAHTHVKYLAEFGDADPSVSSSHVADLITSLHVNYLIARASILVRNGICISSARPRMSSADFLKCVAEILAWASDIALTKLRITRYFEVRSIFNYLDLYFSFIVFLQCEENGDFDLVANLIPYLFAKALDLNKFLQGSLVQFSKSAYCQYVQVAIAENMSKVSHLIAGLLIRFVADRVTPEADPSPTRLVYSQRSDDSRPMYISVSEKDTLISETDRTIQLLENSLSKDSVARAIRIWRFYMTFIRNSHKMSPAAYAKLHAEALGAGKIVDKCPVIPKLNMGSSTIPKMSCPVAHGSTRNDIHEPFPSKCPVDYSAIAAPTSLGQPESRKRQCPFDHEALRKSKPALGSFNESNTRGQQESNARSSDLPQATFNDAPSALLTAKDFSRKSSQDPVTPISSLAPLPSVVNSQNVQIPSSLKMDSMDWDTLSDFNFDLVGDEGLLMLINGGYFDNAPSIEAMFQ